MIRYWNQVCFSQRGRFSLTFIVLLISTILPWATSLATIDEKQNELLQFTSGGHVLGFQPQGVYIASGDHVLRVGFLNTQGVKPISDRAARSDSKAQQLSRVSYPGIWPGIDLAYESVADGIVESTWAIAPGADPAQIRIRYSAPVAIETDGSLKISYETGWMRESAPIAWQKIDGHRIPVMVTFELVETSEDHLLIGFDLGQYDSRHALWIDPTLEWNTFMGSTEWDFANTIAVDGNGDVYIAGRSATTWGTPLNAHAGGGEAFVTKLDSSGNPTWHTFMGSSGTDEAKAVTVDPSGNVYVTGNSNASWGSPVNAFSGTAYNGFVAKLNSSGNLQWNTFIDPGQYMLMSNSNAVAVDGSGNSYLAGTSYSSSYVGQAIAVKLNASGVNMWQTFLGSSLGEDSGHAVAVDDSGNVYIGGYSFSSWGSPVNAHAGGAGEGFTAKLNNSGVLQWNTFMGSTQPDAIRGITVDDSGNAHVTGTSRATWGTPVNSYTGDQDAFVAKLDNNGNRLWNTFLGSASRDEGYAIAVDGIGNVLVIGDSQATWGTPFNGHAGGNDAFVAKLNFEGALNWNSFLGGTDGDGGRGVAVDGSRNIYVSGQSPLTWGSPVNPHAGGDSYDAFAAKIIRDYIVTPSAGANGTIVPDTPQDVPTGATAQFTVTPDAGYSASVGGTCGGTLIGNVYTTNAVTADCTVEATFALTDHTVTPSAGANGSIEPDTPQGVATGSNVQFRVTPDIGYTASVGGTCGGTLVDDIYTTNAITADCTVEATFTLNSYTVNASVDVHGSLDTTSQMVNHGSTASFTVTPDMGYTTDTAVGGDCPAGSWSGQTYTTGPITGDCSVNFTHTINSYTVSASVDVHGSLDSTFQMVTHGAMANFTVTPDTGYTTDTAAGGDCPPGSWSGQTYTTGAIFADCTVSFTHTINSYTASTSAPADQGSFTPESQTVNHGDTTTFEVNAEDEYIINTVTGCGGTWTGTNPYTTGPITADCTVEATFTSEDDCTFFIIPTPDGKSAAVCL